MALPNRPVNPVEALSPFRPGADGPWDRAAAAHLLRRAAFGMLEQAVSKALELGPRRAADDLLAARPELEDVRFTTEAAYQVASLESAQAAWVYRMLRGANPAREKLALFWHGHFATSNRKVENVRLMMRQLDLFRDKGAGPFEALLQAVARDPAMLNWLDGNSNRRGKPNENFARELMELFSLGIGHYTEADIKEAARAFTGWHVKDDEFWFNERAHDRGAKTVFGVTKEFGGEEIVQLCSERQSCAEFVAGKLFEFYVHPAPSPELRRELGKAYAASGKNTADFLAQLLSSRAFHSTAARRALVGGPADFTVGSLSTLGGVANVKEVAKAMGAMGQELLQPPSVKGWELGQAWLNSGTLMARYRFAQAVALHGAQGLFSDGELDARIPWDRLEPRAGGLVDLFFPEGLSPDLREDLKAAAGGNARAIVAGCLELPEYQFV